MLYKGRRESGNVEDQRRFGAGSMGIGGLVIGAVVVYLMGGNPLTYLLQNAEQAQTSVTSPEQQEQSDEKKKFASVVLADTEDVWNSIFQQSSKKYIEPRMVLFTGRVQSACGSASSALGPFYCPGDQKLYLDLGFFQQLSNSLGAKGDFAEAYVIAHEVGHHVQNLLGIEQNMRRKQQMATEREKNQLSVILELQADCLAGVWAKQTEKAKSVIEPGDIDEALGAASAVGDDRLQKRSEGEIVPDSFTHGTSAQRQQAFRLGFENGQLQSCLDNFRI